MKENSTDAIISFRGRVRRVSEINIKCITILHDDESSMFALCLVYNFLAAKYNYFRYVFSTCTCDILWKNHRSHNFLAFQLYTFYYYDSPFSPPNNLIIISFYLLLMNAISLYGVINCVYVCI